MKNLSFFDENIQEAYEETVKNLAKMPQEAFDNVAHDIKIIDNLSKKKFVAASEGTLSTSNAMFAGFLIVVILIVGALTFLPALALGPIADFFTAVR